MPFIMTSLWYLSEFHAWVYQGCFWHCIWHDKCHLLWQAFDFDRGYTFKFIKAVSDSVLDMINAMYYDKPLIFTRAIRLSLSRLFRTVYYTWYGRPDINSEIALVYRGNKERKLYSRQHNLRWCNQFHQLPPSLSGEHGSSQLQKHTKYVL